MYPECSEMLTKFFLGTSVLSPVGHPCFFFIPSVSAIPPAPLLSHSTPRKIAISGLTSFWGPYPLSTQPPAPPPSQRPSHMPEGAPPSPAALAGLMPAGWTNVTELADAFTRARGFSWGRGPPSRSHIAAWGPTRRRDQS